MPLFSSIRRAGRVLLRRPGSTAAAVFTLALGIAVWTAIFSLSEAVLFRKLPYPDAERIAALDSRAGQKNAAGVSWQDIRDLRTDGTSFAAAAVCRKRTWGFADWTSRPLEVVLSGMITNEFFDVLGVKPLKGELYSSQLELKGANHVVWLSWRLWKQRYSDDANVIGKLIALNDSPYRVAGVLPEWFRFAIDGADPDLYIPLDRTDYCCARDGRGLLGIARLAPGVSMEQARAELELLSGRLLAGHPDTNEGVRFTMQDLQQALVGERRRPLSLLFAAVCLLMLVAVVNAAGLLLARAAGETRDAAVRVSLGAGWRHLAGERIAESLWIGIGACAIGIAGAYALLMVAPHIPQIRAALGSYTQYGSLQPDGAVLVFSVTISILASLLVSLFPVLGLRRASLEQLLRSGGATTPSRRGVSVRNALAVTEMALSVTLLLSTAVILRSLFETLNKERGFRSEQVVMAGIGIPEARYDTDSKMIAFHERVIEKLRSIPGVSISGGGVGVPTGARNTRFLLQGQDLPVNQRPSAAISVASPDLLRLLGIPILEGRAFMSTDRIGEPLVALVNRSFTRRYLGSRNPVGARLRVAFWNGQMKPWSEFQIVGVTGDTLNRSIEQASEPAIYLSTLQVPLEGFLYMARTTRDSQSLTREFREAVWSVDRNIQTITPRPLEQYVEQGLQERRVIVWMLGAFAAVALFLAMAGLSAGLVAYVAESRLELGVRAALGETPTRAISRVCRWAGRIVFAGLFFGIAGTIAVTRILQNQAQGISPLDPIAIVGVLAVISLASIVTVAVPAWRVAHADPAEALREG